MPNCFRVIGERSIQRISELNLWYNLVRTSLRLKNALEVRVSLGEHDGTCGWVEFHVFLQIRINC